MLEELFQSSTVITSPVFDSNGELHFCSSQTGDVVKVEQQSAVAILNTKCPNGIGFDKDGKLYVCDFAEQAVLVLNEGKEVVDFVKLYEGNKLLGPNSICFASNGTIYFTDSGPIGESTIQKPIGSVYTVVDGEILQPISLNCLAHPSALTLSPNEKMLYVCETMKNRILRFVQKPKGVYHCTVFYQFSGNFGPTAVACDQKGYLYVANFDFADLEEEETKANLNEENEEDEEEETKKVPNGLISVISPKGKLVAEYTVPGTEITGLCIDREKSTLYITEGSTKTLYRMKITDPEEVTNQEEAAVAEDQF